MSNSSDGSWSGNPNSPQFFPDEYISEKDGFTGILICAIFHGIVIALFLQCMGALLSPTSRVAGGMRWGLVALTTAMFLFSTITLALNLNALSFSYIDNRGHRPLVFSGPLGYWLEKDTIGTILTIMISLNQWLADGLLLYRCHVIYDKNYKVTAFPCLVYLISMLIGVVFISECSQTLYLNAPVLAKVISSYLAIIFSLNVLLTLMIVARLARRNKEILDVVGTSSRAGEWCKATATIFVESCAPYAISLLLYLVAHGVDSLLVDTFYLIFIETQVIAPLLIILRISNRTAVTSDSTIGSRTVDPARLRSQEESAGG